MIKKIKDTFYKILIKTQKFTKTDNVYLVKHSFYLLLSDAVNIISVLILAILYAKFLSQETYGEYKYILSIIAMIGITALPGIDDAINRAVARGFEGTVKDGLKEKIKWSLLGSLILLIIGGYYFFLKNNFVYSICLFIAALFFPVVKSFVIYQSYLDGKKMFNKRAKYCSISTFFYLIVISFIVVFNKNLITLIFVYFFTQALYLLYFYIKTLKKYPVNNKSDIETIKYGKHLSLMLVITLISDNIDKILLFNLLGPAKLAIYSFATMPIEYLRKPLYNIRIITYPKFSTQSKKTIKKTLPSKILKLSLFVIPSLIIIYVLFAPYAYKILFSKYQESVFYSCIYALSLIFFPASLLTSALQATKETKKLYKIFTIMPIFKIILFLFFIPLYGIFGAILSILLSNAFYLILSYFYFKRI